MTAARKIIPTEHVEQCHVVTRFHYAHPDLRGCLFAIPNGGARHKAVAAKLRAEGVRKGVSDLFLMVPRGTYAGLFIEMKRIDASPSDTSPEQLEFQALAARMGYRAAVCKGADEAMSVIASYLAGEGRA